MKYVIDIDEEYYKKITETTASNYMPYKLIANGKLLQAEIEKIKAELHQLGYDADGEWVGVIDNDDVMDILDNHIKELKGENNAE